MHSSLSGLGVTLPVLAAPMAGGPGTPGLVVTAGQAGSLGFLAGGYRTPDALADQIAQVRAAGVAFGVNLFAPNPVPVDPAAYHRYRAALVPVGQRHGVDLAAVPVTEDDDGWAAKIDLLLADPVPVVGFTFGLPDAPVIRALRRAGTLVAPTVTTPAEARQATEHGADLLVVQAVAAGGHSGTWTPQRPPADVALPELLARVAAVTPLPLVAAGGLGTPGAVAAAMTADATAVAVGTALLRSDEAGTSAPHRAALADPARTTVVTRAFTGRPARGLRNRFTDEFTAVAPSGYPALHHLTRPLRQAATAAGDPEQVNLWAGTGHRHASTGPAAAILRALATAL